MRVREMKTTGGAESKNKGHEGGGDQKQEVLKV